jgi:hypothetical protein
LQVGGSPEVQGLKAMIRVWICRIAVIAVAAFGISCDDDTPTTPTTPGPAVTETFTGTVTQNGAQTHSFSTGGSGAVTATLKEVGPDSSLVVGFSLGNWNATAGTCLIVLANDAATAGSTPLSGTITGIGNLCVRVYDVGNVSSTTPVAYTVEVVHP